MMPFSPILQSILSKRGIVNPEDFLSPPRPADISLFSLGIKKSDFKKALSLIKPAKKKRSPVVIYGDYDADGITSTAIIWEALYYSGFRVKPFIPHRRKHGYGLSIAGLKEVIKQYQPELVITVDNGITAYEAVKFARENKIKVIIIDHHQPVSSVDGKTQKALPAEAIIHSVVPSGAGLTWLFTQELTKKLKLKVSPDNLLELAAIGTVTDMVPLLGINRSIVKYGLENIKKTKRAGIKYLARTANIPLETIESHNLGFHLGPRINSMGRIDNALDSLRLLCTKNPKQAQDLSKKLNSTNRERQELTDHLTKIAMEMAQSQKNQPAIIISGAEFHEGVIGLIASRLTQKYWRPAIVLAKNEGFYKASARSIPGFNIISAIRKLEKMLESAGGHPMAAGFNIQFNKLEKFTKKFIAHAKNLLTPDMLKRNLDVDAILQFNELNEKLLDELDLLAPFGVGNKKPLLSTAKVKIVGSQTVGADKKHLKLCLENNNRQFPAIGFGMGHQQNNLTNGALANIAYHLNKNYWNGKTSLQLQLKSIQPTP